MGKVQRVGIEAAGIGRVREVADTVKQIRRLPGDEHDRPGRTEAHHSSGVSSKRPCRCSPVPVDELLGLPHVPLDWETFCVS